MILWGIVTVCQGFVSNFAGLAATRWFLGLFEAGLFPGKFYESLALLQFTTDCF